MRLPMLFMAILVSAAANAQNADQGVYDVKDREFTAEEVKRALGPPPAAPGMQGRRTRGLSVEPVAPRKLSMQLQFAFDSAEITVGARSRLEALGTALASPELSMATYIVSGHTDRTGRYDYNIALSRRRAEAVKAYLVANYRLDPDRLIPVGKGPDALIDPSDPAGAANRRVQIEVAN